MKKEKQQRFLQGRNKIISIALIFSLCLVSLVPEIAGVSTEVPMKMNQGNTMKGWSYSMEITINPKTPDDNFQVKIMLNSTNFEYSLANSNGNDLRFYDLNNNSLPYWIEEWNPKGTSTIWIKVLKVGTERIEMYYGNPTAQSQSNGENTFLFFDDFSGATLNLSKWTVDSDQYSSIKVNSGILYLESTTPNPWYQYTTIGFDNLSLLHGQTYGERIDEGIMIRNDQLVSKYSDNSTVSNSIIPKSKWETGEIEWINSSLVQYKNDTSIVQLTTNIPKQDLPVSLGAYGIIYGPGTWWGIVLKSKTMLAGNGLGVGFNYIRNSAYESTENPSLACNWIYVRLLDKNAVYHIITEPTNILNNGISNKDIITEPTNTLNNGISNKDIGILLVLVFIGIMGVIVIIRARTSRKSIEGYTNQETNRNYNNTGIKNGSICINCNVKIGLNDRYCQNCGTPVLRRE